VNNSSTNPAPTYYTIREVADLYGVKPWTINRLIREGKLPCLVLGPRTRRVTPAQLLVFEERTRPQPTNPRTEPQRPNDGRTKGN
jgi:excisionase family DNA binding protein